MDSSKNISNDADSINEQACHALIAPSEWQGFDLVPLQPVDKRHYTQVLCESLVLGIIAFIGVSLALVLPRELQLPLLLAILTGLLLLLGAISYLRDRHARSLAYATCEHELIMQKGFWWVKRISLPYSRLQHVSLSHGPLERHFNLSTIKCFSAGSGSAEIELPGIEQHTAEHLRQHLLAQAAKTNPQVPLEITSQEKERDDVTKTITSEKSNDDA
ncbi:PH domain-containing protein [uncultured Shewanella sp.]|uniref:PH domain-containing protein n=1 Tax=uncultured Shewanella sp. TaxID=173975 RepID=UPI00260BD728|nr:PH domain-containing protein [uncultured Shewanella sp.]